MNKKVKESYQEIAAALGFRLDEEGGAIYGESDGYDLILFPQNSSYPYILTVSATAKRSMGPLTKDQCKEFKKAYKPVAQLVHNGMNVQMSLKNCPKTDLMIENLKKMLPVFTQFLKNEGFENCCQACGGENPQVCYVSGGYTHLCSSCFTKLQNDSTMLAAQKKNKHENIVGGIVGALLGSLLGALSIIIFSQLGYVAVVSGLIMAICTLKGYELLGGKLTKKGIVISVLIMIFMTYFGDRLDWAIVIMREFDADFLSAYQVIPYFLMEEIIEMGTYVGNLVIQYLFVLLGAIPATIATMKNQKTANRIYCLNDTVQGADQVQL